MICTHKFSGRICTQYYWQIRFRIRFRVLNKYCTYLTPGSASATGYVDDLIASRLFIFVHREVGFEPQISVFI